MAAAWQKITAWACLVLAAVIILHVALGEVILTVLLIMSMSVAFTYRKKQLDGHSAEDVDLEDSTTANPLNSEETPSAELRRSAPAEAAPVAAGGAPTLP